MKIDQDQIQRITESLKLLSGTIKLYAKMLKGLANTVDVLVESIQDLEEE